ncbi:SEC-C metal-binding domain-containing protein [Rhizobium grahamii]
MFPEAYLRTCAAAFGFRACPCGSGKKFKKCCGIGP